MYGLEKCRQLWRLEINNNKVDFNETKIVQIFFCQLLILKLKSLDGLSKFLAIGTLNLHENDLNWNELEKIRHLHIIDLTLTNNSKLDKDPYCNYNLKIF